MKADRNLELKEVSGVLVRHTFGVIFCTLIGISAALGFNFYSTPMYQSSSVLFISTPIPQIDLNALAQGGNFGLQRVKSYSDIVDSPAVLDPVLKELELDLTLEELTSMVKSKTNLETVLITITVTDSNPSRGAAIVNSIAAHFSILVNNLELPTNFSPALTNQIKVSVVTPGVAGEYPATPRTKLNIALGVFLGFSLGGLMAFDVAMDHPEEFKAVGVFSGSFWWRSKSLDAGYIEHQHRIMHNKVRTKKAVAQQKFFFQAGKLDEVSDRNNNGIIDSIDDTIDLIV